jgi:hypothetical protein
VNLSPAQIAQYAAAAGFTGNDLLTAVDIALAESNGGNPNAYFNESQDVPGRYGRTSANDGKGSYGLWQIYLAAHPEFAGENLADPQTNANAAYSIYAIAGGFTPWSTYTSGEYGMYESPAVLAAVAAFAPSVQPANVQPLTLDASTGQPIVSPAEIAAGAYLPPASPSVTDVLLWGGLAVGTLWLLSEVM